MTTSIGVRGRSGFGRAACCLVLLALPGIASADVASKNNDGNRLYEQKKFEEALKSYTDAQASKPGAPELHYNIGNVLFRKGEFAKAIEEYRRAQSAAGPSLSEAATFNRGNAHMMQGQLQEAIGAYVQALRARPDDQDAKRNLELALRLMQQQKKQQQQSQDQKDQEEEKKDPRQQPPPPKDTQQQEEQKKPQKQPGQMSEDEARQILEALRESEKDGVKKHAQASAPSDRRPEEDW
jgi:Ca-activated chloride channel family protein